MLARTAAVVAVVLAGCAGPQESVNRSEFFVGHSSDGDVVIAATHYGAMSGMATTAEELGLKGDDKSKDRKMLCQRETPTGTHVPRWVCRYQADIARERELTRDWLDQPRLSFSKGTAPAM
jgi:hypothetical protein